jgi:glycosyltransferase involved in cell wall biosynthesis
MYPTPRREGWGAFVKSQVESVRSAGVQVDVLVIDGYRSVWNYVRAIFQLRRALASNNYDLVHAHYGLSGLVARCQWRIPLVVSYCGDDVFGHAKGNGRPRLTSMPLAWLQRGLSLFADGVIVKSEAMKRLLPARRVAVITNGVDLELFRPSNRQEARRALGLDEESVYVLFPYDPTRIRKNMRAVEDAVDILNRTRTGDQRPIRILTVHGKPQSELPKYMAAADVLVLASFWEGSPNVIKEALACNMRIVSTGVGDVRERISGVAGTCLCKPTSDSIASAILAVVGKEPNGAARRAVGSLSLSKVAERVIDVYKQVLERAPRPPTALMIVENLPVPFDRRAWQEAVAIREAGWRVAVICPRRGEYTLSHEVIDGIDVYRHPLPEARGALGYLIEYGVALLMQTWLTFRIWLRHGFNVVHACNPPDLIFLVVLPYKLLARVKFVFDHHDLCPELAEAKFGRAGLIAKGVRHLLLAAERATFWLADVSIAPNESYRRIAISRGGMKPEDVFMVRSAPDLRRWRPVDPDPALRHGAKHLVGYVGVMGNQEGLSDLLRAVHAIVHIHGRRDIRFVLVGSGPELPHLLKEADELGVGSFVDFTGRVSDEVLTRTLSSCDLCVNPDTPTQLNSLSSMNKIVEYMALGKPIVQFDLHEGRVTAGAASLYATSGSSEDFAAKIMALLDDPVRAGAMGEFGRRRVMDSLSWAHQVSELLRCYARVRPRGTSARLIAEHVGSAPPAVPD